MTDNERLARALGRIWLVAVALCFGVVALALVGCDAPDYRVEVNAPDSVKWLGYFGKAVTPYPRAGNGSAAFDVTLGGERGARGASVELLTPGRLDLTLSKAPGGLGGIFSPGFEPIARDTVEEAGKVAKVWGE